MDKNHFFVGLQLHFWIPLRKKEKVMKTEGLIKF